MYPDKVVYKDANPALVELPTVPPDAAADASPATKAEVKVAQDAAREQIAKIKAASNVVREYLRGRVLTTQTITCLYYVGGIVGTRTLLVPVWPITSPVVVTDDHGNSYMTRVSDPNVIRSIDRFDSQATQITVKYTGGYSAVPEDVQYAVRQIVATMDSLNPNKGLKIDAQHVKEEYAMPPKVIPFKVRQLLNPYVMWSM